MRQIFLNQIIGFLFLACTTMSAQTVERLDIKSYVLRLPEGDVRFDVDTTVIVIKFFERFKSQFQEYLTKRSEPGVFDSIQTIAYQDLILGYLSRGLSSNEIIPLIAELEKDSLIEYVTPVLKYKGQTSQYVYDLFYVKIKSEEGLDTLQALANELNFLIQKEYEPNIYFCRATKKSAGNAFELALHLQHLNLFEYVEPDFIYTGKIETNDTYFNSQWALKNTGQFGGTIGSDVDAENAWSLTTGSSTIKVAILDCFGSTSQFTHPDITFHSTYDATGTGFNSSGFPGDAHGISCAGIIRASGNNSTGTSGLAYTSSVIAVKICNIINAAGNWNAPGTAISDGINWAYNNADVISNSNNFGSSSSLIENAISNAVTLGRNHLGAPFLSSSGNGNSSSIVYPASNPNTIAVGATSMCDQRKSPSSCDGETYWGSDYGTGLDVAAPGVHIYTTDITGSAGYVSGSYNEYFNGTSAACPMAAGVVALLLSMKPNASNAQARYFLESTCEKVGGYTYTAGVPGQENGTWSTALGYGRINAYQALLLAAEDSFCNNDYSCGPPAPTQLSVSSTCINSGCSTIGATPPSPNIPFNGGSACTTPYQSGRYDDDVWFTITPPTSSPLIIRVAPTSNLANFDVVIGLYQGSCSGPTQVSCADINGVGVAENLNFTPSANTTYSIRVFSYGIGSQYSGDFSICVFTGTGTPNLLKQTDGLTISGNTLTINTTIQNNGTATASGSIARFALSVNSNFSTINHYIGTQSIPAINSNSSASQTKVIDLCAQGVPTGTYYLGYFIDYFTSVTESNESDNGWWYWGSTPIVVVPPGSISVSGGGSFCNSAVLTASGGSPGTIYWQGTTSNGTSTATPSTSQTVSASGTYYFRSYNGCGWGPQGSATVTINTVPGPVTVSGSGTYCNSAILTASGGSGGTIYWQETTSNGTSTATPSTSQTVTSSGTYYFRANNSCGWGNQGSAIVNINTVINTNDSGAGSLRNTISCVDPGSTIYFSLPAMSQINLTSGEISINKNISLLGSGLTNLTLTGNNSSRIFHITSGNTLVLKDLSLKDANGPAPNGGALFVEGNLSLENVLFEHNFENTTIPKAITITSNAGLINMTSSVDIKN